MSSSSAPGGPRGLPLLGNALSLSRGGLEYLRACAAEYGDLVPFRFLWKRVLLVNHPDLVAQVLATSHRELAKGIAHRTDRLLVGEGLSLSEGDAWRHERRLMQPSFHRDHAAAHGEAIVALTERMLGAWRDGETRDVWVDLSYLAVAIVARTLFGIDVPDEAPDLPAALAWALECRRKRVASFQVALPDRLPTPASLRLRRSRRKIEAIVGRFIQERRSAGDDRGDLLAALLRARDADGRPLTGRQVCDEVLTVFVGGNETVADLLAWTWYSISQHPAVEARLLAELDATLAGRLPTVADLPRLPHAATIVAEALRLYPPAPVLGRNAMANFELGGYRVTRGTEVLVSPWVMHRDPRYFDAPDAFDPDRWADGLAHRLPRYAYFPFGGGPRLCIGRSFATLEALLVLATVASRYRLALRPGHPVLAEPIPALRPKFGMRMIVRARARDGASIPSMAASRP
jgi:cytochrome P450